MTRPKIDNGTWLLVADGEKALFLENLGDDDLPNFEVRRQEEQPNPANRDQAANRPGRLQGGPGSQRSAVADTDWHALSKERFAKELAEILYKLAHADRFKKIVLVAPPGILGDLRGELHPEVSNRVVGEIAKTLTNHPIDKIETLLAA